MNTLGKNAISQLSPLAARGPRSSRPAPGAPEPPEQNGDKATISGRAKVGAGVMLGLTAVGLLAGCSNGNAPATTKAPQAQIQLCKTPSQTWISTQKEVELGKQASAQLEKECQLWNNPEQQARLQAIGQRLASTSSRQDIEFSFKMLDTDVINAMALPGGNVYATRALMQKFPDDDQLAFVLGHEIAHVEQRHVVAKLEESTLRQLLTLPLSFRQWNISKIALDGGDEIIGNRYGQVKETEADKLGQEHIARMGIDPDKAADAMKNLMDVTGGKEKISPKLQQIFSDHPPTQQRIDNLHQWAKEIKARQ